jgi:very-short-patch-repair endonuclease
MDPRLLAICATHGAFLRREANGLGYRDDTIKRLVSAGVWHRVRRGAYVFGETWREADKAERYRIFCLAAIRQSKTEVIPSHTSAVALHDGPLWGQNTALAHLTRMDGRTGRKAAGVQQHRGTLVGGDTVVVDGRPVMAPTRAALETTTVAPVEASLCVVDDFLHRGLTTPEQLASRYELMTTWPATLTTDLVLRLADGRRASVGETRTGYALWRGGIPRPEPQLEVRDENGVLIGIVDFAWPDYRLFLEFDGVQKYVKLLQEGESINDVILREKHREEAICGITGWRCIRITWADLARPEVVLQRIRNLMAVAA